jgi:hypothetical protein
VTRPAEDDGGADAGEVGPPLSSSLSHPSSLSLPHIGSLSSLFDGREQPGWEVGGGRDGGGGLGSGLLGVGIPRRGVATTSPMDARADLSRRCPIHKLRRLEGRGPYQATLDLFPHRQQVPHINEAKVASFYSPHFLLLHILLRARSRWGRSARIRPTGISG